MATVTARVNQLKFNLNQPTRVTSMATNVSEPQPILMRKPLASDPNCAAVHFSYIDVDRLANFQTLARRELERRREAGEIGSGGATEEDVSSPVSVTARTPSSASNQSARAKSPLRRNVRLCEKDHVRSLQKHGPLCTAKSNAVSRMPPRSHSPPVRDTDDWKPSTGTHATATTKRPMSSRNGPDVEQRLDEALVAMNEMQAKFRAEQEEMKALLQTLIHSSTSNAIAREGTKKSPRNSTSPTPAGPGIFKRVTAGRLYPQPPFLRAQKLQQSRVRTAHRVPQREPRHVSPSPSSDYTTSEQNAYPSQESLFSEDSEDPRLVKQQRSALRRGAAPPTRMSALQKRREKLYRAPLPKSRASILRTAQSQDSLDEEENSEDGIEREGLSLPGWRPAEEAIGNKGGLPNVDEVLSRLDQLCSEAAAIHRRWPAIEYEDDVLSLSTSPTEETACNTWLAPASHPAVLDEELNAHSSRRSAGLVFTRAPRGVGGDGLSVRFQDEKHPLKESTPSGIVLNPDKAMINRLLDNRDTYEEQRRQLFGSASGPHACVKYFTWADQLVDNCVRKIVGELEEANEEMVHALIKQEGVAPTDASENSKADFSYSTDDDFS